MIGPTRERQRILAIMGQANSAEPRGSAPVDGGQILGRGLR